METMYDWFWIYERCEICKTREIRTEARYEAWVPRNPNDGSEGRFMLCSDHFDTYADKSVSFVEVN